MSRQTGGHTGPHAYPATKMLARAAAAVHNTPGSRKAIKKNHNRKTRQYIRKLIKEQLS
jgi:hypothetical protein